MWLALSDEFGCIKARVVEVLSLSTTPHGSFSGFPSFIKEVKKKMVTNGKTTIQQM